MRFYLTSIKCLIIAVCIYIKSLNIITPKYSLGERRDHVFSKISCNSSNLRTSARIMRRTPHTTLTPTIQNKRVRLIFHVEPVPILCLDKIGHRCKAWRNAYSPPRIVWPILMIQRCQNIVSSLILHAESIYGTGETIFHSHVAQCIQRPYMQTETTFSDAN